jgi:photosystem II stability/assembly factor-like uncharacterized protein
MNKKYDNNNIIIASRAYFLQTVGGGTKLSTPDGRGRSRRLEAIDYAVLH